MKEQKVVITSNQNSINSEINKGYRVVSVTAQMVTGKGSSSFVGKGDFCFVLERE